MGKHLENKVLVIESEHSFYYTNQKYIPIDYVIKSLKALEKTLKTHLNSLKNLIQILKSLILKST